MKKLKLILVRGLPGIEKDMIMDQFHEFLCFRRIGKQIEIIKGNERYISESSDLYKEVEKAMQDGENIVVDSIFAKTSGISYYYHLANRYNYFVIEVFVKSRWRKESIFNKQKFYQIMNNFEFQQKFQEEN